MYKIQIRKRKYVPAYANPFSPPVIPNPQTQSCHMQDTTTWTLSWTCFPGGASGKDPPAAQEREETQVRSLGREGALEEGRAAHSRILARRIPWTGEPGGLPPLWGHKEADTEVTEHTFNYTRRQK